MRGENKAEGPLLTCGCGRRVYTGIIMDTAAPARDCGGSYIVSYPGSGAAPPLFLLPKPLIWPHTKYNTRGCLTIARNEVMINEDIRDPEIRLIDTDGTQLGIMSSLEALAYAGKKNLDLVKIAPLAKPPVCKVMDYGKHMFEQSKKEKEARRNQKVVTVKEIRLKPQIEEHDLNIKVRSATKILKDGDKVKVSVRFRGREMNYTSHGIEMLNKFAETVDEFGTVERAPKMEGRSMIMILNSKMQQPVK